MSLPAAADIWGCPQVALALSHRPQAIALARAEGRHAAMLRVAPSRQEM